MVAEKFAHGRMNIHSLIFSLAVYSFSLLAPSYALAQTNTLNNTKSDETDQKENNTLVAKLQRDMESSSKFETDLTLPRKRSHHEGWVLRTYYEYDSKKEGLNDIFKNTLSYVPWILDQKPELKIDETKVRMKLFDWRSDKIIDGDRIKVNLTVDYNYGEDAKIMLGVKVPLPE